MELEPTEHPLAVDQREGITEERARQMVEGVLHPGEGTHPSAHPKQGRNLLVRSTPVVKNLLWIDCIVGAIAGVLVLMFSGWLGNLQALPRELLLLNGAVNLLYASYSFSLAVRATRPRSLIKLLVFANLSWALVCLCLAAVFAGSATVFGIGHLAGEAVFVGGLAGLEWRWRDQLLARG